MANKTLYIIGFIVLVIIIAIIVLALSSNNKSNLSTTSNPTTASAAISGATGSKANLNQSTANNLSGAIGVSQTQDVNYTSNQNVTGSP